MPSSQRRPAAATGRSLLTRWADVVIKRPAALLAVAVGLLVLAGSYGLGVFGLLSQAVARTQPPNRRASSRSSVKRSETGRSTSSRCTRATR